MQERGQAIKKMDIKKIKKADQLIEQESISRPMSAFITLAESKHTKEITKFDIFV